MALVVTELDSKLERLSDLNHLKYQILDFKETMRSKFERTVKDTFGDLSKKTECKEAIDVAVENAMESLSLDLDKILHKTDKDMLDMLK